VARWIGVDVGGTGVRAGWVSDDGALVGDTVAHELVDRSVGTVVDTIVGAVRAVAGGRPFEAVGVGVPGFVVAQTVVASPNFPEWDHVPLGASLSEALGAPVTIENDANAATWGAWVAAGRWGDLVMLTLGTGVGGGVVSEGRLLRGRRGSAAELGHIPVGGDRPCLCGGVGCLEVWCSTVGLVAEARRRGIVVADGRGLIDRVEAGDAVARAVVAEAGEALGRGLVAVANVFAPDRIVLAGGLAAARPFLEPHALPALRTRAVVSSRDAELVWFPRAEPFAVPGAAMVAASRAGS
jgi:glucokinase